jgi:serine/threonine-protein kinase
MSVPIEPAVGGWRLPLALRIFLLFALLLAAAIGAAVFITWREGQRIADEAIQRALATSAEVQTELTQRRLEEVQLKVALIGNDPAAKQYVSAAQGGGLGLGNEGLTDTGSIDDLLRERQEQYGFDLGIVLDTEGGVLSRTDSEEAVDQSLAGDPFVEPVLRDLSAVSGFWRFDGKLYQAAMLPLDQDQDLIGFLLVALQVDDELAARVGKASGADVAFVLPGGDSVGVIGTSLDKSDGEALQAALLTGGGELATAIREGKPLDRASIDFGGQRWVAGLSPLDAEGGGRIGSVLRLSSADRAAAGFREILNLVALSGLAALVFALPLSFLLAKATLRPLATMARAANDAAGGNYQTRIGIRGTDELAQLSRSFDTLLSDLREKSDIEGYVTNLSRFLPDPGQEQMVPSFVTQKSVAVPEQAPATRERLLLLGVDLRQFAKPLDGTDADLAIARVSERAGAIEAKAASHGGQLISSSGPRAIVGFRGDDRLAAALATAHEALTADTSAAAALMEGEVAYGTLTVGTTRNSAAVGPAYFQIDRLLCEAPAGRVLLPRTLGESARALLGGGVEVVTGMASGKSFYGIGSASLAFVEAPVVAPSGPPPEGYATVDHTSVKAPARVVSGGGELAAGTRFGGRYEILSVLGSGGMGVVYKARDVELDDVVALKMLKPSALVDREHLERLKSEIKLARKITHPNVLRTFDFGEVEGRPYVSMEYVRGMTLRYLLRQAGRIPYSAALRIARQLVAGLGAAHAVGVLHRDVKPENLILEASGNAKLMDFGIARPIRRSEPGQTQPGMFVGTPHYSAPEQLAGDEVDHRADIYSSGVTMCEMFCGKLPFSGQNTMEIYLAQMQTEPIKPSNYWPEIPKPLEAVILRSIEREPAKRYQSATELAAALAELRA